MLFCSTEIANSPINIWTPLDIVNANASCGVTPKVGRCESINDIGWNEEGSDIPCEEVKATDLFDYVIPYGIDPANDQYAKFRKSLTSYLANCKECLAKMNELHSQVYSILECKSNIVTVFKTAESGREDANLPIAVEVFGEEKDEIPSESYSLDINTEPIAQAEKVPWRFKPVFKLAERLPHVRLTWKVPHINIFLAGATEDLSLTRICHISDPPIRIAVIRRERLPCNRVIPHTLIRGIVICLVVIQEVCGHSQP